MRTVQQLRKTVGLSTRLAVCVSLLAACGGDAGDGSEPVSQPRVCPECTPASSGKSDSASSLAACGLAYLKRDVDQAEAEKLGFPVTAGAERIERPIDTPMTWVPKESDGGGPASGYERKTRIRGRFNVDSYAYGELDPERCDGTFCKLEDGSTTEQAPCPERYLMMRVSGELETLDGAIAAKFPMRAVNLRLPGQVDDLVVAAYADLSEVRGSLKIDPRAPVSTVGQLDLSLQFEDDERKGYGVLSVSVYPDWENLSQDGRSSAVGRYAYYSPIEAQWGDAP